MQNVLSPMVNMYQTQLEASRRFADAIFSGTEKIDRVMIGATHRVFTEQLRFAQALSSIRDPRNVGSTLQSGLLSRNPDDAVSYQKEIMRIFAEMQNEIGRSMQDYIEQLGTNAATSAAAPIEEVAQGQAQANDAVFNPMTSMFSVWESAFKEVAALAKKNMAAARSTVDETTSKAMEGTDMYATAASNSARDAAVVADTAVSSASAAAKNAATIAEEGSADEKRGPSPANTGKRK